MPRAKTRVASRERRKKIINATKGYFGKKRNCITIAKDALWRSGVYSYRDRRRKKRDFRSLWIIRINAGARLHGMSYSEFIHGIQQKGIELNRKTLAHLAMHEPDVFAKIVEQVKASA